VKPYFLSFLALLCLGSAYSQNKGLSEAKVKKMLQGFWVFAVDSNYTMVFSGDTMLEYHLGEKTMDIIEYGISNKGCDNHDVTGNKSKYYLLIDGDEDEAGLCAELEFTDDKHLFLVITEDQALELKKKQ
jgi:hypothetical protein